MLRRPALENSSMETPVGRPGIEREGGSCKKEKNEILGIWPVWPLLSKFSYEKVLVL